LEEAVEFAPHDVRNVSVQLFQAAGAPKSHAETVADHLLESSLMGLHSHGIIRVPEYLERVEARQSGKRPLGGPIDPTAEPTTEYEHGARAIVNGNGGFGQVAGMAAVELALRLAAEHGVSAVSVRNAGHAGRVGAYTESVARRGAVALAFCSGPIWGHWVAPFGARDGRMATNPISYAFPAAGDPVVADFATSAYTEGGIRYHRNRGLPIPPGVLRDSHGNETTDPNTLYSDPGATIMPLGGEVSGHKGSALGLLVDLLATLLAGDSAVDEARIGNNLTLLVIPTDASFVHRANEFVDYVRSARPIRPAQPILMPGDRELEAKRSARTVYVDDPTWVQIVAFAERYGVPLPSPVAAET
jgi:uncharacterized oxidoreductase